VTNNIRVFTGLAIPDSIRSAAERHVPAWKAEFPFERWAHPADWHVTLHFLGETDSAQLPAIRRALEEAAQEARPFGLALDRLGTFGNPRHPSVLWLGLVGMLPQLRSLHSALGSALHRAIGFTPEERPFHPHLTIARKYAGQLPIQTVNLPALPPSDLVYGWTADSITLFQSHPGRSPMYEQLMTVPLTTDRDTREM